MPSYEVLILGCTTKEFKGVDQERAKATLLAEPYRSFMCLLIGEQRGALGKSPGPLGMTCGILTSTSR